jgi:hypothetical protein
MKSEPIVTVSKCSMISLINFVLTKIRENFNAHFTSEFSEKLNDKLAHQWSKLALFVELSDFIFSQKRTKMVTKLDPFLPIIFC